MVEHRLGRSDRPGRAPVANIDRRRFLQFGGAGAVAAALGLDLDASGAVGPGADVGPIAPRRGPQPSHTVVLRRREDQLHLGFEFWNLELDTSGPEPRLVRRNANQEAFVVVVLLPQHVQEEAFYETAGAVVLDPPVSPPDPNDDSVLLPPPVGNRVAGSSRLAFSVPQAIPSIPYTPEALLDWSRWEPSVVPAARPRSPLVRARPGVRRQRPPKLRAPGDTETALELPWWLVLSPHAGTGWVHAPEVVSHGGRSELWHTRFGARRDDGEIDEAHDAGKTVRAVWARDPDFGTYLAGNPSTTPADGEDFDQHPVGMPWRTPLSQRDRYDIVVSTSDFRHEISEPGYVPDPADVDQLMLSSMGAWMDVRGQWEAEPGDGTSHTSLQSWRHISAMGRDQYVRIVRSGALFPCGHGCSLIKVSERRFRTIGSGGRNDPKRRIAYMFQRYFIVLRQRVVDYGGPFQAASGRAFPFTSLRATTLITPTLAPPAGVPGFGNTMAFVPTLADGAPNEPFLFQMVGTDRAGRTVDLALPTVFVDGTIVTHASTEMATLRSWYNARPVTDPVRTVAVGGQKVAPAAPTQANDTDLEMHRLTLGAEAPGSGTDAQLETAKQPGFFPTMTEAEIRLAAAEVALGDGLGPSLPVVVLDPGWVASDFNPSSPGEVFVRLKDTNDPTGLDFGAGGRGDRSGGVITPNVGITAISRATGTVGGNPDTFQAGTFEPADFFGSLNADLLGDIALGDVIAPLTGFDLSDPVQAGKVMRLQTRDEAEAVVTELRWAPGLQDGGTVFKAELEGVPASLDLTATFWAPKSAGTDAKSLIVGDLRHFAVALLPSAPFLEVRFDRLRFQSETGKKTDVDVDIREVVFAGPLEFVDQLRHYLSFGSGGFSVALEPTQVKAGFELPIPSITLGVFSLQNLTFAAGTTIPFTGQPIRFRFGFNTVDNPFLLSVMIFGGGGFFELAIGADGVESFQAALEFGAMAALNFGVASGSVSVTAGIYLAIGVANPPDNPDGAAELTGFIKLKGEVEVLGIISLGIFMKAGFTYIPATKKAAVRAVIVVEINVLLFSASVEIEYEKTFGGSHDPTFGQSLSEPQWSAYTAAFAPIGA